MKKLALLLYVGCVLAFSAFARAEVMMPFSQVPNLRPIHVETIEEVDAVNLEITVAGHLPTPCTARPMATLVLDTQNPNTLVLHLLSPLPSSRVRPCVQVRNDFSMVVNLPMAAQNSLLKLDEKAMYMIRVEGADVLPVLGADLMRVPGFITQ